MGDENLINKILNNLINNALKFTKQGGVVVRAGLNRKNNTEYACITVHDTGIGIPAEYLEVIFEEFRQASEGHTRAFEGTGLGLHLASSFARIMNGEITVQSTEGKGSAFTLWLPAAVPLSWDDPVKLEPVSSIQNLDFLNKARILLVEDDKDSLDLALLILKSRYQCDFAVSGKGAVELASKNQYSCILMDISLKGEIGGIGAIDEIRKLPGYGAVPIAAFTANALSGHREEYLSKGCTHYLSKPYKRQDLINLVDEMVLLRGALN
jgi:CheY-like chemotaxis protein